MFNNAFEQEVLRLTNEFRVENGLNPLVIDQNLEKSANKHTRSMAVNDFFAHTGLDDSQPWDRAEREGYESRYVGENIAAGYQTPQEVFDIWKNSSTHRANLLNPNFNEIGLSFYVLENDTGDVNYNRYWTQVFGRGSVGGAAPLPTPPVPPTFDNSLVIKGTTQSETLVGGTTNQRIYGRGGDDIIESREGHDRLIGSGGDDQLFGGAGDDELVGGSGDDLLQGAAQNSPNEKDILNGGGGGDRFVLGDEDGTFYDDGNASSMGLRDYALITRFNAQQGDIIQLSAKHSYRIGSAPQSIESGQAIFIEGSAGHKDELIAVIQRGRTVTLDSGAFDFV